jgi:glyoxylase-like metal-dependent hydrolase (beta-lactamase superfamily II)
MRVTGHAQRDARQNRVLPPVEQVRPGIWSVPVPIPHNPLRYTLTYVVEAGERIVVVDPGWDVEPAWAALVDGFRFIGADVADVTGIVVTHVHPDHHGLSARVKQASGAWVAMHPAERDSLPARTWEATGGSAADEAWLRDCGVPDDVVAELALRPETMAAFLAMAPPDLLLEDCDLVPVPGRRLRAVWTPGHTPGHLCLYDEDENLLLTGDHVLPRISPNIGLQPRTVDPPLASYLTRKLKGEWARDSSRRSEAEPGWVC